MQESVQKYSGFLFGKKTLYLDYMKMMSTLIRNFSEAFFMFKGV